MKNKNYPDRPHMEYPLDPFNRIVVRLNLHIDNLEQEIKAQDIRINKLLKSKFNLIKEFNEISFNALEFAEWCSLNGWTKHIDFDLWINEIEGIPEKNSIELYNKFKE